MHSLREAPTLSICIPTYNRSALLAETLASIESQWCEGLEVTVADNGSEDDTEQLIEQFRDRVGAVRYFRWDSNHGPDRNFLKAVEISTGRWCWILGSDDPLMPGAVAEVLRRLKAEKPNLLLFNRMLCERDLTLIGEDHFFEPRGGDALRFDFSEDGEFARYLRAGRSLAVAFSYLSSIVFERQIWDATPGDDPWIGSSYVHVYKLLSACRRGATLTYIDQALVKCRLGNDSFRAQGLAERVLIDLRGFAKLSAVVFDDSDRASQHALRGLLRLEYPWSRVMRYQGVLGRDAAWPEILSLLDSNIGYPIGALALARVFGRSRRIVDWSFRRRDARLRTAAVRRTPVTAHPPLSEAE